MKTKRERENGAPTNIEKSPKGRRHIYTVELRLFGAMDPDAVTAETGLQPSDTSHAKFDKQGAIRQKARWTYNGGGPTGAYQFDTLEQGLVFVLERAWSSRHVLQKYAAGNLFTWWCGHFQTGFDGGPTLSVELLKRLGEFGAEFFLDNYHVDSQ